MPAGVRSRDARAKPVYIEHMGNKHAAQSEASAANRTEPRWPAMVALLAVGLLRFALPESLSAGPAWLLIVVIGVLMVPTTWSHRRGLHEVNKALSYILITLVTADVVWSLGLLVVAMSARSLSPLDLLRGATALWVSNILVFASWYWRLDAGGPHARDLRGVHCHGAFLFPQMTLSPEIRQSRGEDFWTPGFVDYLFLSFNTSTAFSPTDCPVLTRWAKLLMMLQALISLATVVLLAARAVNIL